MKKVLSVIALLALLFVSCEKKSPVEPVVPVDPQDTTVVPVDPRDTILPFGPNDSIISIYRIQIQPMGTTIAYMLYDDESGKAFVFPLNIPNSADDVEPGKLYTLDEMNKVYAYWMLSDYTTHSLYTDAKFVKFKDEDGLVLIKAKVSDQNGDTWNLVYDESKL